MPDKLSPSAITKPAKPVPDDAFGDIGDTHELTEPLQSSVAPSDDYFSAVRTSDLPPVAEEQHFTAPMTSPLERAELPTTATAPVADDEPVSFGNRLMTAVMITLLYALIGLLIDVAINVVQSLSGIGTGKTDWLFLPILAVLGVVFGLLFGSKALDIVFAPFRDRDDDTGEDLFTAGILRAIGLALAIGVFGWLVMMMLM